MSLLTHTKPISYLKANAAKIAQELKQDGEHYVITRNGEAAMVVQSVREYEQPQETLAMLKMLAQSDPKNLATIRPSISANITRTVQINISH